MHISIPLAVEAKSETRARCTIGALAASKKISFAKDNKMSERH